MRYAVLVAPLVLALACAGYFAARPHESEDAARLARIAAKLDQPPQALDDDAADGEIVREALAARDLSEAQIGALVVAAGRRWVRRKLAVEEASRRHQDVAPLEAEADSARKLCDLAESLSHHNRMSGAAARADWEMEKRLELTPGRATGLVDRFQGSGKFSEADLAKLEREFQTRFGHPLPVSARGMSAVHRVMGFDHRGRFDVAVQPEGVEGVWVRRYLSAKNVPFFAFNSAVPGQATGAHIHIGPASTHGHAAD